MQRSSAQVFRATVETVATQHPAGTVAGLWYWDFSTTGGVVVHQQQTALPTVVVSLNPGAYTVAVRLEDAARQPIGETAEVSLEVAEPDVIIQTAGSVSIEPL